MEEDGQTIIYSGHSKEHITGVEKFLSFHVAKVLIGWTPVNERISAARFQTRKKFLSFHVAKVLIGWTPVNERISAARFQTRHVEFTINQANDPTMEDGANKKDNFYKTLQSTIDELL